MVNVGPRWLQWPWYGAHHAHDWGTHKKQWHVWHVAHSQLCLKNKSTHKIPNKKTIQYLSIIYKWGLRTN